MKNSDFDKLVQQVFQRVKEIGTTKGREYASSDDRLANFKREAERLGLDPLTVWHVYASKHWDAISTFVKDVQADNEVALSEPIDGRYTDLLVYALLGLALLKERGAKK